MEDSNPDGGDMELGKSILFLRVPITCCTVTMIVVNIGKCQEQP